VFYFIVVVGVVIILGIGSYIGKALERKKIEGARKALERDGYAIHDSDVLRYNGTGSRIQLWPGCGIDGITLTVEKSLGRWRVFASLRDGQKFLLTPDGLEAYRMVASGAEEQITGRLEAARPPVSLWLK
jgi:hypothetical protein